MFESINWETVTGIATILGTFIFGLVGWKLSLQNTKLQQSTLETTYNSFTMLLNKELRDGNGISEDKKLSWVQDYLNTYESICISYIHGDIDKKRFMRTRKYEIVEIVELDDIVFKSLLFPSEISKYDAIWQVYKEIKKNRYV